MSREVAEATGWVNNPSRYDVDLRLEPVGGADAVLWRDMSWPSARAGESRRALPASLHPTVAAGFCFAALERLRGKTESPASKAPVLLDPCCGAGTILREWLSLSPDSQALGYDLSEEAVEVSRLNLQGFASRATIEVGDMGHLPLEASSVDAVIANLPFGIRVKHGASNRRLYSRFLTEAIRLLRPGGQLLAYTGDSKALEFALSQAGIHSGRPLAVVEAGGLDAVVYRVER
ncbi:MAG: methyltransferase domain-containing protein [bacterium]|nr:methyltransferase domain-containing protein [bacterium]